MQEAAQLLKVSRSTMYDLLHVVRNVAARTRTVPVEDVSAVVLTPAHAQRLCAAAEAERIGAGVRLALYLGMRMGEILGLR